jgi:hypothetical protein
LAIVRVSRRNPSTTDANTGHRPFTALAEHIRALYLDRRDQNTSHLTVFAVAGASSLAR